MKQKNICKKAILLGATGGIGRELAERLAVQAEELEILGRDQDRLEKLAAQLQAKGMVVSYRVLNLENLAQVQKFSQEMDADLVINCSGLAYFGEAASLSEADEERIWLVNYQAPLLMIKEVMRKEQQLTFVQLSSLAALVPHPFMTAYGASKSALQIACLALQEEARLQASPTKIQLLMLGPTSTGMLPEKLQQRLGGKNWQMSPGLAACKILKAVKKDKAYAVIGICYRFLIFLLAFLPQQLKVRILGSYLKRGIDK